MDDGPRGLMFMMLGAILATNVMTCARVKRIEKVVIESKEEESSGSTVPVVPTGAVSVNHERGGPFPWEQEGINRTAIMGVEARELLRPSRDPATDIRPRP